MEEHLSLSNAPFLCIQLAMRARGYYLWLEATTSVVIQPCPVFQISDYVLLRIPKGLEYVKSVTILRDIDNDVHTKTL